MPNNPKNDTPDKALVERLKPCPFCGGQAELRKWDFPYERHQVRCSVCKAEGAPRKSIYGEAVDAWNTRAALSQPQLESIEGKSDEQLADMAYGKGYDLYRNKWIGDHEEMCADLVRWLVPRAIAPNSPVAREKHSPVHEIVDFATTGKWLCEKCGKTWSWNTPAPASCVKSAPTDTADRRDAVARPDAAIEALTNGQQQADMDGTFVKVSRQALDETLAYIAMIAASTGEA